MMGGGGGGGGPATHPNRHLPAGNNTYYQCFGTFGTIVGLFEQKHTLLVAVYAFLIQEHSYPLNKNLARPF